MTHIVDVPAAPDEAKWRSELDRLSLAPLWESEAAYKAGVPNDGSLWEWRDLRPVMETAGEMTSPAAQERRVIELLDRHGHFPLGEGTVGTINACLQFLKPGETARPHRHPMDALRFVLESSGGVETVVDGKRLEMNEGDLVLTPGWHWHAHNHGGTDPVIWLDVLDVALHRYLGSEQFQPGPAISFPDRLPDAAFSTPNIVPVARPSGFRDSPVLRYPWSDVRRALATIDADGSGLKRVRYANPLSGGPALQFMDLEAWEVDAGRSTTEILGDDMVLCVVEGGGVVTVGETQHEVVRNDICTLPRGRPVRLDAGTDGPLRCFIISNSPLFEKLGIASARVKP